MVQPFVPPAVHPSIPPVREPSIVSRSSRGIVGFLLVVPAALALVVNYVVPTVRTVRTSLSANDLDDQDFRSWVGLDNYRELTGQALRATGHALSLAAVPLLMIAVVAPLIAYLAHRAGRATRRAVAVAFALPMAAFAPVAVAAAWRFEGRLGALPDPAQVGGATRIAFWLTTLGLTCGIAVTVYLAAWRGGSAGGSGRRPALVVGTVLAVAAVAVALQDLTYSMVLNPWGVDNGAMTPAGTIFGTGFRLMDLAGACAVSTLLLVVLAALGTVVTVLLICTGTRIEFGSGALGRAGRSALAVVGAVAGTLAVLAAAGYGLWPWLSNLGGGPVPEGISTGTALVNTWLPPLVSTVVGIVLAALAGFGIGAVRPLGRHSEWLLLLFAPWLFVGLAPFIVEHYTALSELDAVGTFVALVPPFFVVIPALVVLTLFFRGQERVWRARVAAGERGGPLVLRVVLLPALPLVALLGVITWVVNAQSLIGPLALTYRPEELTGPVVVLRQLGGFGAAAEPPAFGLVLPVVVLVVLVIGLVVLQLSYLDRLAVRTGHDHDGADAHRGTGGYPAPSPTGASGSWAPASGRSEEGRPSR